jgi:hypothetical protein
MSANADLMQFSTSSGISDMVAGKVPGAEISKAIA